MTLPDERYRAVMWASRFLQDIAHDQKKYPRIPKAVRQEAYSILRHYPNSWDLQQAAHAAPEVFAETIEDVQRLFMKFNQSKDNENQSS